MVKTKDESIKILIWCYLTQKITFFIWLLLEARAKKCKKLGLFIGRMRRQDYLLSKFTDPLCHSGKTEANFYQSDSKSHTQIHNLHMLCKIMLCLHICVEHVVDWCRKVHQKCKLLQPDAVSTCLFCACIAENIFWN